MLTAVASGGARSNRRRDSGSRDISTSRDNTTVACSVATAAVAAIGGRQRTEGVECARGAGAQGRGILGGGLRPRPKPARLADEQPADRAARLLHEQRLLGTIGAAALVHDRGGCLKESSAIL